MFGTNTRYEQFKAEFDSKLDHMAKSFLEDNSLEGVLANPDEFLAGLYTIKDKVNKYFPVLDNHRDHRSISLIEQVGRGPEKYKTDCRFPAILITRMIERDADLDYLNGDFVKFGWLNWGKDSVAGAYCRRNYIEYFVYVVENGGSVYILQNDMSNILKTYSPDADGIKSFDSFFATYH